MTKFPVSIPFLWCCVHPSDIPLCPKKDGFSWGRSHVSSFQHPEVSAGGLMIVMVEESPPVQAWAFLGFIFHHSPLPSPTAAWQWLPAFPQPHVHKGLLFVRQWLGGRVGKQCVSPHPRQGHPRAEAGPGEATVTGPSAGVKTATPSSDQGEAESWAGQGCDFLIVNSKIMSPSCGDPQEIAMEWWYPAFFLIFLAQSLGMRW